MKQINFRNLVGAVETTTLEESVEKTRSNCLLNGFGVQATPGKLKSPTIMISSFPVRFGMVTILTIIVHNIGLKILTALKRALNITSSL